DVPGRPVYDPDQPLRRPGHFRPLWTVRWSAGRLPDHGSHADGRPDVPRRGRTRGDGSAPHTAGALTTLGVVAGSVTLDLRLGSVLGLLAGPGDGAGEVDPLLAGLRVPGPAPQPDAPRRETVLGEMKPHGTEADRLAEYECHRGRSLPRSIITRPRPELHEWHSARRAVGRGHQR